jgi:hypothetical protein
MRGELAREYLADLLGTTSEAVAAMGRVRYSSHVAHQLCVLRFTHELAGRGSVLPPREQARLVKFLDDWAR